MRKVKKAQEQKPGPDPNRMVRVGDLVVGGKVAARIIGMSVPFLYQAVAAGRIVPVMRGQGRRPIGVFLRADLLAERQRISARLMRRLAFLRGAPADLLAKRQRISARLMRRLAFLRGAPKE